MFTAGTYEYGIWNMDMDKLINDAKDYSHH